MEQVIAVLVIAGVLYLMLSILPKLTATKEDKNPVVRVVPPSLQVVPTPTKKKTPTGKKVKPVRRKPKK